MGVDVTAYSMFGVEMASFQDACQALLDKGVISQDEYEDSLEIGEVEHPLYGYVVYSCYSGGRGVLGCHITAENFYTNNYESLIKVDMVKEHFPEATFHLFCQWH